MRLSGALEHAIGLYLAGQPPYPRLLDCLDEPGVQRLLRLAGYRPPDDEPDAAYPRWRRPAGSGCPQRLFTAAACLAHLHRLVHDHLMDATPDERRRSLRIPLDHRPVIRQCQRDTWQARAAFGVYWASFTGGFHHALRSYGVVTIAPALLDGHRHADLITGNTVVDIKPGRLDRPGRLDDLVDQLLTYALLAPLDGYPVTHIAAYLARHELLIRYPVQHVADELAGTPVDLPTAGAHLTAIIRTSERRPPARE